MSLHKIKDFDPNYRQYFDNQDIIGFDLYSNSEKVGSIDDILVDDNGNFRYFVIHTGAWILGKKTLLPVGRARYEASQRRVDVESLSLAQIENLPEFDENNMVDYDQEELTRSVYRSPAKGSGMDAMSEMDTMPGTNASKVAMANPIYDRDTYDYQQDKDLYDLNAPERQTLKLYEERLVANKTRQKTGEVAVAKRVETETAKVSVPIEKERIVIERKPGDATAVTPGEANFQAGEVARMEVYEETPDIHKEAFVREEVSIRKEVDRETVQAEEQLRREELDIDNDGKAVIDRDVEYDSARRVN